MKGVLVGADLMYRKDGSLAPIEINTNTGFDETNRLESYEDVFKVEDLVDFCSSHNIEKLYLEGTVRRLAEFIEKVPHTFEIVKVSREKYEELEDTDNILAIRTFYSDEALVDAFCRDKINFLKSLKGTDLECEYLLKTENGLEGNISRVETDYPENVPNFILKYRYPNYSKREYPKLYRFNTLEELHTFAESMEEDFFLMPYYFCENKLYNNERIQMIRNWSVFVAEDESLKAVEVGKYTKVCQKLELDKVELEENEISSTNRYMFLTTGFRTQELGEQALLEENDLVWMADGSWKKIQDVKVGDLVKALDVPYSEDKDISKHTGDYGKTLEEFQAESTFTENEVKYLVEVERFENKVILTFTDGTDWFDTPKSSYPVVGENGNIWFKNIDTLVEGDTILMLNIEDPDEVRIESKIVESKSVERKMVKGYGIGLDGSHLFITRTSEDAQAYASIEHNAYGTCTWGSGISGCYGQPGSPDGSSTRISCADVCTSDETYVNNVLCAWPDYTVPETKELWSCTNSPTNAEQRDMCGCSPNPQPENCTEEYLTDTQMQEYGGTAWSQYHDCSMIFQVGSNQVCFVEASGDGCHVKWSADCRDCGVY